MFGCIICDSFSFRHICQNCLDGALAPSLFKRNIDGFSVFSFYKYSEIAPLIRYKHKLAGSFILSQLAKNSFKHFAKSFEFSEKIAEMYLAVDLVIGRSGATTIQEIANAGMPSILIPAQLSDQQKNARLLDLMKASEVVREDELTKNVSILFKKVELILRDEQLKKVLSESVLRLAKYNSAKQIAELILTHRFEPKLVRKS